MLRGGRASSRSATAVSMIVSLLVSAAAGGACAPRKDARAGGGVSQAAEGAQPVITIASPVYDFGTVMEGEPARHKFEVKNTGGAPLDIKSLVASCGCTAAALKQKILAPGDSTEIEVTFDTRGRRGKN